MVEQMPNAQNEVDRQILSITSVLAAAKWLGQMVREERKTISGRIVTLRKQNKKVRASQFEYTRNKYRIEGQMRMFAFIKRQQKYVCAHVCDLYPFRMSLCSGYPCVCDVHPFRHSPVCLQLCV